MEELLRARLKAVASTRIEHLRLSPEFAREEVIFNGKKIVIGTYHVALENDVHRVIVQVSREQWGGMVAGVVVGGYEFSADANPRRLREEELYDYT